MRRVKVRKETSQCKKYRKLLGIREAKNQSRQKQKGNEQKSRTPPMAATLASGVRKKTTNLNYELSQVTVKYCSPPTGQGAVISILPQLSVSGKRVVCTYSPFTFSNGHNMTVFLLGIHDHRGASCAAVFCTFSSQCLELFIADVFYIPSYVSILF